MPACLSASQRDRGTVLILCVSLLVLLGLLATTFVLLTHAERASSRDLSRADRFEEVRRMALAYVRARLLDEIIDMVAYGLTLEEHISEVKAICTNVEEGHGDPTEAIKRIKEIL